MSKNEQKVTKLWPLQNSSPVFLVQTIITDKNILKERTTKVCSNTLVTNSIFCHKSFKFH